MDLGSNSENQIINKDSEDKTNCRSAIYLNQFEDF